MTNRTRLYLDVDGVINAQMPFGWGRLQNGHAKAERTEYRIRWAPAMIEALNELDVDLVWTTTWRSDAETNIAPLVNLTLPSRVLHPLGGGPTTFPSIDWKRDAVILDQKESPSPFLWLDDEIGSGEQFIASMLGGLAFPINHTVGIRTTEVDMMREYIENHKTETLAALQVGADE